MGELYGDIGTVVGPHKCDKDARIAELEAALAQAEKKLADHLAYWGNLDGLVQRAEQAEAALAKRDRMLSLAWVESCTLSRIHGYDVLTKDEFLADLRARAEEGSES